MEFPELKSEITILPASPPTKLNWVIYEHPSTNNNTYDYSSRAYETDEADKYLSRDAKIPENQDHIYTTLPVLEFLNGKPWNNLALNAVMALRPSIIRVVGDYCTCDCVPWRVTVFLKEDKRTISRIEQEVEPGTIGCKTGHDFSTKIEGRLPPPSSDVENVFVNEYAINKITLD